MCSLLSFEDDINVVGKSVHKMTKSKFHKTWHWKLRWELINIEWKVALSSKTTLQIQNDLAIHVLKIGVSLSIIQ